MKEIVIRISDYNVANVQNGSIMSAVILKAVKNGTELPKGHTELIDTKKLIQSVARSADNMKNNGVAPVFDAHEITNLILAQDVLIEADKEYEVEAITRGNCMICGKELTEGLFFCKECENKASSGKEE